MRLSLSALGVFNLELQDQEQLAHSKTVASTCSTQYSEQHFVCVWFYFSVLAVFWCCSMSHTFVS
jgi:hypothetical protein